MPSAGEAGLAADGLPISPELILVSSPEEQQRARERLPPSPAEDWDLLLAGIRARAAFERVEPVELTRARKPRRMLVLASLALVAVAVPIGMAGARDNMGAEAVATVRPHVQGSTSSALPPVASPAAPSNPAVPTPAQKPTTKAKATPKARATAKQPAAPQPAAPTTKAKGVKQPAGFVPSRVWGWVAQPGSVTYVFRLYRNGQQVYAAHTTQAQLVLPKSFRFAAGKYRWSVVVVGNSKTRTKPLVESTFVLSAATAAKANS